MNTNTRYEHLAGCGGSPSTAVETANKISPVNKAFDELFMAINKLLCNTEELERRLASVLPINKSTPITELENKSVPPTLVDKIDIAKSSIEKINSLQDEILRDLEL